MTPTIVETKVTAVTVYPDRARVTVAGQVQVEEGPSRWHVEGLPITLQPDSLRVHGVGQGRVRILGATVRRHHFATTPAEKVAALQEEIANIEKQMRTLEDGQAVLIARGEHLAGLRAATEAYAKGLSRGDIKVADQAQLIDFLQEQDVDLRSKARTLEQQMNQKQEVLDQLRRELKELQSQRPLQRHRAEVEVDGLAAGPFELRLTYVISGAGWRPLYDVRLTEDADGRSLAVTALAEVRQNTGQDWLNVAISLSTARPALNQRLPDLQPWYLDVHRPAAPHAPTLIRAATADAAVAAPVAAKAELTAQVDEVPAEVSTATVTADASAVRFDVPGAIDIPSDGAPHKTTMFVEFLQPQLDYLTIPRHTDAVYRRATVVNKSPAPWLGGSANLFVGDAYIGQTQVEFTPRGSELTLLLGVEERITVERELVRREVEKRLLRDRRQIRYGYSISMQNLLREPVKVTLRDQVPVARHEEISVKLHTAEPVPDEVTDMNLLTWEMTLAPDTSKTTLFDFVVEYPQAMSVRGLVE